MKRKGTILNNFKTVAYKGSKRKLVSKIVDLAKEVNARRVFDGFSGTGIVSAVLRANGFSVTANDLNPSSYVFGKVFLEGYNHHIHCTCNMFLHNQINKISPYFQLRINQHH